MEILRPAVRSAYRLCIKRSPFSSLLASPPLTGVLSNFLHSTTRRSRSNVNWTPELDSRISQLHGEGYTWKQIGESLHLSSITCYQHYRSSIAPVALNFWTPKRNRRLQELALEENKSWTEIAKELSAIETNDSQKRTNAGDVRRVEKRISGMACRKQWCKVMQSPTRRQEPAYYFKQRDKDLLRQYLMDAQRTRSERSWQSDAAEWRRMARTLFDRRFTTKQIKFQSVQLLQDLKRWTKREDAALIEHVMKRMDDDGTLNEQTWLEAAGQFGHHRSPEDYKNRWDTLQGRLLKKHAMSPNGLFWSEHEIQSYWIAWRWHGNDWDRIAQAVQSIEPTNSKALSKHTTSIKTPKDCRDDFKFLVTLSIQKIGLLKQELGNLAQCFSGQPRKRPQWTQERLERLERAVSESGSSSKVADIDWETVARSVGDDITAPQCRYRWNILLTKEKAKQTKDINTGRWGSKDTQTLQRALRDLRLLGSTNRLPLRFSNFVRVQYNLKRTHQSIRRKAKTILEHDLYQRATNKPELAAKARLYLRGLSQGDRHSLPDSDEGIGSFSPGSSRLDTPLSDIIEPRDIVCTDDEGLGSDTKSTSEDIGTLLKEQNISEDTELEHLHPEMFIAPGILKSEVRRSTSTLMSKVGSRHFMWRSEDEEKLYGLVKKYEQSTLSWKQIALEMSIPVRKCKDKWRNLLKK
ncbi:MAG: hypothetical protein J3Q66DRAFT_338313 [Benniella sp.]|nr:MAG: hypothetical protein J3Q66DRAFT_338313 [Benniella sp.]